MARVNKLQVRFADHRFRSQRHQKFREQVEYRYVNHPSAFPTLTSIFLAGQKNSSRKMRNKVVTLGTVKRRFRTAKVLTLTIRFPTALDHKSIHEPIIPL